MLTVLMNRPIFSPNSLCEPSQLDNIDYNINNKDIVHYLSGTPKTREQSQLSESSSPFLRRDIEAGRLSVLNSISSTSVRIHDAYVLA